MKVLLIDPWGINNTSEYLNGLISGLSSRVDLSVFTNVYFEKYVDATASINRVFFKKSEKMMPSRYRTIVRGLEYLKGYSKVLKELKKEHYDVVHINWLLNYKLDIRFLKRIKKYCPKIVYTAHNVLPHVDGESSRLELKEIYSIVDVIIIHGHTIKSELIKEFPETEAKVYIQKHGCILKAPDSISVDVLPGSIKNAILSGKKIFVACGAVFPNKGIDRLANIWLKTFTQNEAYLIIGGRQMSAYPEYERLKPLMQASENVILLDGFIEDDVLNCIFENCTAIVLPYRHASMSGIVFSAAQYAKPILCTNVGALVEYLKPDVDSLVCANDDTALEELIKKAVNMDDKTLKAMGEKLKDHIQTECDWDNICAGIVRYAYTGN